MCLTTGCKVEERQLKKRARLEPCIAILGIVAARLLQLKLSARNQPNAPAKACVPSLHVQLLAAYWEKPSEAMTARALWRDVARLGGFLGRKCDGDPGWRTLWRGRLRLDAMAEAAALLQETEKCNDKPYVRPYRASPTRCARTGRATADRVPRMGLLPQESHVPSPAIRSVRVSTNGSSDMVRQNARPRPDRTNWR